MESYIIPRNIKVKEVFVQGLTGKQMLFLVLGAGGALLIWSAGAPLPIDVKLAGTVMSLAGSLSLSLAKVNGQELDRYAINCVKYPMREKTFGGEEVEKGKIILNLKYTLES